MLSSIVVSEVLRMPSKKLILLYFIFDIFHFCYKVTRLIPEAHGTTFNQRIERISGTQHSRILWVPLRIEKGVLHHWFSLFDVWPYLEIFSEVKDDDLWRLKLISFLFSSGLYARTLFRSSAIQCVQCCKSIETCKSK